MKKEKLVKTEISSSMKEERKMMIPASPRGKEEPPIMT